MQGILQSFNQLVFGKRLLVQAILCLLSRRGLMLRPLRLKMSMLLPLRLKIGMFQFCATEEFLCGFARPKKVMLRHCATQKRYVATLQDPKKISCDTARPIKVCDLYFDRLDQKMVCFDRLDWVRYVSTDSKQDVYVSTTLEHSVRRIKF